MTDLVRYQPPTSSIELAPSAWKLAEKIASTDFVPPALRGKPEAVLACILAGHEAGISPMQALSKIHIIEGRPAMASELMRALVLQHGHELDYEEVSTTKVVAAGRRRGSERWTKVTWTMDDAKRGGLDQKQNWRKWPRAMLIARATAELCRLVFPDVLAGISYTVEELSDGGALGDELVDFGPAEIAPPATAAAPARATAKADRAITKAAPKDDPEPKPPATRGELPDLPDVPPAPAPRPAAAPAPAEEPVEAELVDEPAEADVAPVVADDGIIDADVVETPAAEAPVVEDDWPSGEWDSGDFPSDAPAPADRRSYTGPQLIAIRLGDRFGIKGNTDEARAERIRAIVKILGLGRTIESSKDLTPAEISTAIARIDEWPADRPLYSEADTPATVEPVAAGEGDAVPPPSETESSESAPRSGSGPRRPATPPAKSTPDPESWTSDDWRAFLVKRKVKVTELLREAQRIGALRTPPVAVALLDAIAGSGIATELVGWIEDVSLDRSKS